MMLEKLVRRGCTALGILFLSCSYVYGSTEKQDPNIWSLLLNNVFALSIILIFIGAIIGIFIKGRTVDRCLKSFRRFHSTIETMDGKLIYGNMEVYPGGLELIYKNPIQDKNGHTESSFILYQPELTDVAMIYRFHDEIEGRNKKVWKKSLKRTYRPSLLSRLKRSLRNTLGTLKDALSQAMGVAIQMKTPASLSTQKDRLSSIGSELIGFAGNTYEPILERYVGYKVVLELYKGSEKEEYLGILKEYTKDFLEILDIELWRSFVYTLTNGHGTLASTECGKLAKKTITDLSVDFQQQGAVLKIRNQGCYDIVVQRIERGETKEEPGYTLSPSEEKEIKIDEEVENKVILKGIRHTDLIVPRSIGLIRHASEQKKTALKTLIKF